MSAHSKLLGMADYEGSYLGLAAEALVRAVRPLEKEWVRDFLMQRDRDAEDMALLMSPAGLLNASTFSGVFNTTGAPTLNTTLYADCVFIPCATIEGMTVGLAVQREGWPCPVDAECDSMEKVLLDSIAPNRRLTEHSIGRYFFSNETGELLILSRLLPNEPDVAMASVTTIAKHTPGVPYSGVEAMLGRERLRVLWWSSVRGCADGFMPLGSTSNEKVAAVVDFELFEMGRLRESVIVANTCVSARNACTECNAKELFRKAACGENAGEALPTCKCREALRPTKSLLDFTAPSRNLRSLRGLWTGEAIIVSRVFGRYKPAVAFAQNLSIALDIEVNHELSSQLQQLAIASSCAKLNIARVQLSTQPVTWDSAGTTGHPCFDRLHEADARVAEILVADPGAAYATILESGHDDLLEPETCPPIDGCGFGYSGVGGNSDAIVSFEEVNQALTDPASDMTALNSSLGGTFGNSSGLSVATRVSNTHVPLEAQQNTRTEERKRKNRLAATRSNQRRKERNDALKTSLREIRFRVAHLATVELELKTENVELRRRLELRRAAVQNCFQGAGSVGSSGQ